VVHAKKEAVAKAADERLQMDRELHLLQCAKLRANTHTESTKSLRVLHDIRENYLILQSFQQMTPPPQDMIDICNQNIAVLKSQLVSTSSSTSMQSLTTTLSTTPMHVELESPTPRASTCITPTNLNMNSQL
jgi:hypothetical protein